MLPRHSVRANLDQFGSSVRRRLAATLGRSRRMTRREVIHYMNVALALVIGLVLVSAWVDARGFDVHAYWSVNPADPYAVNGVGISDAFQYAPPMAYFFAPLHLFPFPVAATLWRLVELAALLWLAGPWAAVALLIYPVAIELSMANVHLAMAAAVVMAFRWPGTWAFVLLTKPTCAVALLWYVVRRDWRGLTIALGTTAVVSAISFVVNPASWIDYAHIMLANANGVSGIGEGPPLWVRLPLAALVAIVGARRGWRPSVVVAVFLSLPVWWWHSGALLAGLLAWAPGRNPPHRDTVATTSSNLGISESGAQAGT